MTTSLDSMIAEYMRVQTPQEILEIHNRADARSGSTRYMMDNFGVVQGVKEEILWTHDGSNDSDPMSIDSAD